MSKASTNGKRRVQIEGDENYARHAISLDAERAVLGSMLIEAAAIDEAQACLPCGPDEFTFESHRTLFDVICGLRSRGEPLDGVVIKAELVRLELFAEVGGYDFLGGLVNAVPSALRVRHYAQIVHEKYTLRQLFLAAWEQGEDVKNGGTAEQALDAAQRRLFAITDSQPTRREESLGEILAETMRFENGQQSDAGLMTGLYELDDITGGLHAGELIVVAGRPSMGKTSLGIGIAEHLAVTDGVPVLFVSVEMTRREVVRRIACGRAGIDSHTMRRGRLGRSEVDRLATVRDELSSAPLIIDDSPSPTIAQVCAMARRAVHRHKVRVVFVDYLQLIRSPEAMKRDNREQEVASISRQLKGLAKDLSLPVVVMAQLNRGVENRAGNKPRMSDLRESGSIEQDADVVLLLHRDHYYDTAKPENEAELIVAKQRNGRVGTIKLHWHSQHTRFANAAYGHQTEPAAAGQQYWHHA